MVKRYRAIDSFAIGDVYVAMNSVWKRKYYDSTNNQYVMLHDVYDDCWIVIRDEMLKEYFKEVEER